MDKLGRVFDFEQEALNLEHYSALPDDWHIAIADVVSSTVLAQQGRDKDVNFVAAASLTVLKHQLEISGNAAAIQFGGDGVIAAVPPECYQATRRNLAALADWSSKLFNITLRVGTVSVAELHQAGLLCYASLQVLDDVNAFGLFLGDGIQAADDWIKRDVGRQIPATEGPLEGLDNLSCRWHPINSHRGVIASVIIDPTSEGDIGINRLNILIKALHDEIPMSQSSPLSAKEALQPPALPSWSSLRRELKTFSSRAKYQRIIIAYLSSFALWLAWRVGGQLGKINAKRYLHSLAQKTDYRKQAGGPRMVLDLTPDELDRLTIFLDKAEENGDILYGIATSQASTLTCLVQDFQSDHHIHFIDGQGLGFWRASIMLKEKRLARSQKKQLQG